MAVRQRVAWTGRTFACLTLCLVLSLVVAGCVDPTTTGKGGDGLPGATDLPEWAPYACTDAPRPNATRTAASADAPLNGSITALGFDLLRALDHCGNVVFSPLSIAVLLAMALQGAEGETAESLGAGLGIPAARIPELGALLRNVTEARDVDLRLANSLWSDPSIDVQAAFITALQRHFRAETTTVDLGEPASAEGIDAWARNATEGLIDGIARDLGIPNEMALLVLLNAVYFKGAWTRPFDPEATRPANFTRPDGSVVVVPMMMQDRGFAFASLDSLSVLRLPYGDDERFVLDIFLPNAGAHVDDVIDALDMRLWQEADQAMQEKRVIVSLPRFEMVFSADLREALAAVGLGAAYRPADFSGISPSVEGFDTIAHKAFIRVDEEGTEAAALSGGAMFTSLPPQFTVDRPFVFTLADRTTGTILFAGTVRDPTAPPA